MRVFALLALVAVGCTNPEGRWRAVLVDGVEMPELRSTVDASDDDALSFGSSYRDLQWLLFADGTGLQIREFQDSRWVQSLLAAEQSGGQTTSLRITAIGARGFNLSAIRFDSHTECQTDGDIAECLQWSGDNPEPVAMTMQWVGPPEWPASLEEIPEAP